MIKILTLPLGSYQTNCYIVYEETAKSCAILDPGYSPERVLDAVAKLGLTVDAVLLTHGCSDPLYRRSIRVSMGTVFQVPWAWIDDVMQLKKLGFKTAAMALTDQSVSIKNLALNAEPKLAIVLGTEGDGLATQTIENCDYNVIIPMYHNVDSLNVAAASAVAFWQLRIR